MYIGIVSKKKISDSRTPSPASVNSESASPTSELTVDNQMIHVCKNSPTPDRDSLHIEMVMGADESPLAPGMCTSSLFIKVLNVFL